MRPELETYHQIDSYLNGKLEGEALRTFEQKLQSDPEFAEEVEFQKLTNELVIGASYDTLREQMTKDIKNIDASNQTKNWSLYTIAAFVLITGSAGIYSYFTKTPETKQASATAKTIAIGKSYAESSAAVVTKDSKTTSSTPETQTNISKQQIQAAVENTKVDTQQTVVLPTPTPYFADSEKAPAPKPIQPAEQTTKATKENPCSIHAFISVSPSCINESTGSIRIGGITGGTAPIKVSIPELSRSAKEGGFFYLKADTYTVRIEDANGCVKVYPTEITEKSCRKNSYVFAPEKGETWKISGNDQLDYTITIINIAGTQVYKSNLMQGEFEWQGIGQQGEYLSAGLYIYVIEYANGQKENGQVTIVR